MKKIACFLLFFIVLSNQSCAQNKIDGVISHEKPELKPAFADMDLIALSDTVNTFTVAEISKRDLSESEIRFLYKGVDIFYKIPFGLKTNYDLHLHIQNFLTPDSRETVETLADITTHFAEFEN